MGLQRVGHDQTCMHAQPIRQTLFSLSCRRRLNGVNLWIWGHSLGESDLEVTPLLLFDPLGG